MLLLISLCVTAAKRPGAVFSMQVVLKKCFGLNPRKNLAQIRLMFLKRRTLLPKNDVTEPKGRRLGYFNN